MPEVNVEINGRKYRMACEEGQQQHLIGLAKRLNDQVEGLKGAVGEIGDNRLTVMAGIAMVDELVEAERKIAVLRAEVADLTDAGQQLTREAEEMERRLAIKLGEAADRLEAVASAIDETAPVQQN
ncbi:cell division protein ZapA [Devosia sp.]|uniref:cell division protein ZapA n=1 Tax=Devosia sp. TaxID=1871048 RepID=UPI003262FC5F